VSPQPAPIAPAAVADSPAPAVDAATASASPPQPDAATPVQPDIPAREPNLLQKVDQERADKARAAEAKPVEAKPEAAAEAKPADKPAEPKTEAETKPADAAKAPDTKPEPPAPVEYKYTLPETIKMDDALKGRVHTVFDEFRADPAQGAQKLIDLHNEMMGEYAKQTVREQMAAFNKLCRDKETLILADEEFGGSGHETAKGAVARARDALISSARRGTKQYEKDRAEFEEFNAYTGAGSWPAFWRILHNAARVVNEPDAREIPTDIKPPKNNGRPPRGSMYSEESRQKMNGAN
jgi:hypothetical protein